MSNISVVIPYYQKKAGTLSRTLNSVGIQTNLNAINQVIIVDDGSPVPAENELKNVSPLLSSKLTLIKKENGGVSKARNVGLESISKDSDIVAFLDSDDIWEPTLIESMLEAFELGADFYFTNHYQLNSEVGAFERGGKIDLADHKSLQNGLYEYNGLMLDQIATGNLIGTSTVAYRFNKYPNVRFRENLTCAGEDYLFWMDIAKENPKYIFNERCMVIYEEGINIYASVKWGTSEYQKLVIDEINYRSVLLNNYPLSKKSKEVLKERIRQGRIGFFQNLAGALKRRNFKLVQLSVALFFKNIPSIVFSKAQIRQ